MPKKSGPKRAAESDTDLGLKFELAWQLPYVIKDIYSQLEAVANAELAQFGIGIAVWRILAALWENEELSNGELARYISINVTNLSRVSRVIQREGLIRRLRPDDDQRTVRIRLTKKGRDLVQRIIPYATVWQKEVIGDLSAAEMATLMPLLNRIAANLTIYRLARAVADTTEPAVADIDPSASASVKVAKSKRP